MQCPCFATYLTPEPLTESCWACDECHAPIQQGELRYGCTRCSFDLCATCFRDATVREGAVQKFRLEHAWESADEASDSDCAELKQGKGANGDGGADRNGRNESEEDWLLRYEEAEG